MITWGHGRAAGSHPKQFSVRAYADGFEVFAGTPLESLRGLAFALRETADLIECQSDRLKPAPVSPYTQPCFTQSDVEAWGRTTAGPGSIGEAIGLARQGRRALIVCCNRVPDRIREAVLADASFCEQSSRRQFGHASGGVLCWGYAGCLDRFRGATFDHILMAREVIPSVEDVNLLQLCLRNGALVHHEASR